MKTLALAVRPGFKARQPYRDKVVFWADMPISGVYDAWYWPLTFVLFALPWLPSQRHDRRECRLRSRQAEGVPS